MTINTAAFGAVSRAYHAGQSLPVSKAFASPAQDGPSFEDMVKEAGRNALETIHAGDRAAVAGLKGEISTQEVVEATRAMETALQVTLAVRNKVVDAYTEILRMSV